MRHIEGKGRLVSRDGKSTETQVSFSFQFLGKMGEGQIIAIDGRELRAGHYNLYTNDDVFHVQNKCAEWWVLT